MRNKGKILVIGSPAKARELVRNDQGDRYRFTYCAGDDHPNVSLDQTGRSYEWIVINGEELGGDETELIRSLRAVGFLTQDTGCPGGSGCGVEWLPDGTLQLHCSARPQSRRQSAAPPRSDTDKQGFVFEYHAPVKRTG